MLGIHPLNGQGAIIIRTASVPLFDWIWTNRDELLCIHLSQMAYTSTPPPCASTAAVPEVRPKRRFNAHPVLRQGRACA